MTGFVAYYRVSTAQQGASGLGLEAQREAVIRHVRTAGGVVAAEFQEVESGKRSDRPALLAALAYARATSSCLVIAKLDRLARNLAFVANLMEAGVDFIACDNPHATRLTIHILAAVAEHERGMISLRVKAALAVAKKRGVRLGNPNGAAAFRRAGKGNAASIAAQQRAAAAWRAQVAPIIAAIRAAGISSAREIAAELERRGVQTARGGRWRAGMIRVIDGQSLPTA